MPSCNNRSSSSTSQHGTAVAEAALVCAAHGTRAGLDERRREAALPDRDSIFDSRELPRFSKCRAVLQTSAFSGVASTCFRMAFRSPISSISFLFAPLRRRRCRGSRRPPRPGYLALLDGLAGLPIDSLRCDPLHVWINTFYAANSR